MRTILVLSLCAIHLSGCGILNADLSKFTKNLTSSPTTPTTGFESISLSDSSVLGKNIYVGFKSGTPGGTTVDPSGRFVAIELDGIHVYNSAGEQQKFIAVNRTGREGHINSLAPIASAADGSYFIGAGYNGDPKELLRVSSTGVVTSIPMNVPCYGMTSVQVMQTNGEETVHVAIPEYVSGNSTPYASNRVHVYKTSDLSYVGSYGIEADKPAMMAQSPTTGDIYVAASGGYEIFHYDDNLTPIDSYAFNFTENFDQISFATNGDMIIVRSGSAATSGVYRYSMPAMTLVTSVTVATNPEISNATDITVTSTGFDINVGAPYQRVRYTYSAGTYTLQGVLSSSGSGNSEFNIPNNTNALNQAVTDSNDNFYMVDFGNSRIQSFSKSGSFRYARSIVNPGVTDHSNTALAMTSTGTLLVMSQNSLTNNNILVQKFTTSNGAAQASTEIPWTYPGQVFMGIDSNDDLWFQVGLNPSGLALVRVDLNGTIETEININDTATFFGESNLNGFRVLGNHILTFSYVDYKSRITDFSGNTEMLFADEEYTSTGIIAGFTNTAKIATDGTYYMNCYNDDATMGFIVFDVNSRKITKKLSSNRIDGNYTNVLTSLGLWQGLPSDRMMLLAY